VGWSFPRTGIVEEIGNTMDRIYITDLTLHCIIGVFQEERREKQKLVINVTMDADLAAAGRSDDLADSVDYKAVKKRIMGVVEGSEYHLIESVAHRIADTCLEDPGVSRVQVRVDKPGALRFARSVAVEIEGSRKG